MLYNNIKFNMILLSYYKSGVCTINCMYLKKNKKNQYDAGFENRLKNLYCSQICPCSYLF
jgi:hypothetical protein